MDKIIVDSGYLSELEFIRESSCDVMREFADELGCKPDNEGILQAIDDLKNKVAELEIQRDALVAENAALKHAISEINNSAEEAEYDGYLTFVINADCLHCAVDLIESETPATDQPIIVTDDMAMAFHRATTDGDVGSDDVSDIKIGLNAALCNINMAQPAASQPYTVPDERAAYETFIAKRLGDSIDTQRARNGDPEKPDYMAWDMTVGWIAWQGRAAMLQHHSGDAANKVNHPVIPDGWALVPFEPSTEMSCAGHVYYQKSTAEFGDFTPTGMYRAMLAAAPQHKGE